jgi:hypothetical protein
MLNLSPKARRYISEAFERFPEAEYRNLWASADQANPAPIISRVAVAALAHLTAILEFELAKSDLTRERRIRFSNDLWFVSDLMTEISDSLPTGQPGEHDPYLPSLTGGSTKTPDGD